MRRWGGEGLNFLPTCLLYSRDRHLAHRVQNLAKPVATIMHVESAIQLDSALHQSGHSVLVVDIQTDDGLEQIRQTRKQRPFTVIIVIGKSQSTPILEAEALGVYATTDPDLERSPFQALMRRALDYLSVLLENDCLRDELSRKAVSSSSAFTVDRTVERPFLPFPMRKLSGAFRRFRDLGTFLQDIVDGVANSIMVSRVGIFSQTRTNSSYRLLAGLRYLRDSGALEFSEKHPFVRWLEMNAHLVSRATIEHVKNRDQRLLLTESLDRLGAEVIVPLHARDHVIGWLYVGHRVTGVPFEYVDLQELMSVADYISTMLDNALLYDEVTVQKTLAETLLQSLPTGIIAVDKTGIVRCCNEAAERILMATAADIMEQPITRLGGRLCSLLLQTLEGDGTGTKQEWQDHKTNLWLSVDVRRLTSHSDHLGAVAMIQDLTMERMIREKQEQLDRAVLVAELAATMSHEVRNPLVTVKTFAQLLPERKDEPEFCNEFNSLALKEIDHLIDIIEQIYEIAHPPPIVKKPVNVADTIRKVQDLITKKGLPSDFKLLAEVEDKLPILLGDAYALEHCFFHLLQNAVEALDNRANPEVTVIVRATGKGAVGAGIRVVIQDNGPGIAADVLARVCSPFFTTKESRLGLGLSIAKRIIVEHDGTLEIVGTHNGTVVTVNLPNRNHGYEIEHSGSSYIGG